jgi:hypothetical protein
MRNNNKGSEKIYRSSNCKRSSFCTICLNRRLLKANIWKQLKSSTILGMPQVTYDRLLHRHGGKDFGDVGLRGVETLAEPSADDAFAGPITHGNWKLRLYPVSGQELLRERDMEWSRAFTRQRLKIQPQLQLRRRAEGNETQDCLRANKQSMTGAPVLQMRGGSLQARNKARD